MKKTPYFFGMCVLTFFGFSLFSNIESFATSEPQDFSGPKKNAMSCVHPSQTNIPTGQLACYGIWDYGDEFGDDESTCEKSGNIGCVVKTSACSDGVATATKYLTPTSMNVNNSTLITIAKNLESTASVVRKQIPGLWVYTCGKNSVPVENRGTYRLYLNNSTSPSITMENVTYTEALESCKANQKSNPNASVYCTWKGEEIYRYTPTPTEKTGMLVVKINGQSVMTGMDMTESIALSKCKEKANSYIGSDILCTWNNKEIYHVPAREETGTLTVEVNDDTVLTARDMNHDNAYSKCRDVAEDYEDSDDYEIRCMWRDEEIYYRSEEKKDTLYVKVDGYTVYTSRDITRSTALSRCKDKARDYDDSEVTCIWDDDQIYHISGDDEVGYYVKYINGDRSGNGTYVTRTSAERDCLLNHILYPNISLVCIWDGREIGDYDAKDDDYCSVGYTYLSTLNRCIKESYLVYYNEYKRQFSYVLHVLTVEKLRQVQDRIDTLKKTYYYDSAILQKLETLRILVEEEILDRNGSIDLDSIFSF